MKRYRADIEDELKSLQKEMKSLPMNLFTVRAFVQEQIELLTKELATTPLESYALEEELTFKVKIQVLLESGPRYEKDELDAFTKNYFNENIEEAVYDLIVDDLHFCSLNGYSVVVDVKQE